MVGIIAQKDFDDAKTEKNTMKTYNVDLKFQKRFAAAALWFTIMVNIQVFRETSLWGNMNILHLSEHLPILRNKSALKESSLYVLYISRVSC